MSMNLNSLLYKMRLIGWSYYILDKTQMIKKYLLSEFILLWFASFFPKKNWGQENTSKELMFVLNQNTIVSFFPGWLVIMKMAVVLIFFSLTHNIYVYFLLSFPTIVCSNFIVIVI